MSRISRPVTLALILLIVVCTLIYSGQQQRYSLRKVSAFLDTLDITTLTNDATSKLSNTPGSAVAAAAPGIAPGNVQKTDNNDPEIIEKHKIENQVNELLKKKIDFELQFEREALKKKEEEMKKEFKTLKTSHKQLETELKSYKSDTGKPILVDIKQFDSVKPEYKKKVFTYKTNPKKNFEFNIDGDQNDVVILSSITQKFSEDPKSMFSKFLHAINSLEYPHHKTSLSFLIGNAEDYAKIDEFFTLLFDAISKTENPEELKESYSKITIMDARFIENQFKVDRDSRHDPQLQKKRRRLLSQLRNFLVSNGVSQERYTLSLDSDVIKLPKDLLSTFIESDKDIATIRIQVKADDGTITEQDYDKNAWLGERKVPSIDEEKSLDLDPNFFFEPGPGANNHHFGDIIKHPEKFQLNPNDPKSCIEIDSVGGAVLFVKNEIFQQGVIFPPFYLIGSKWGRKEGFDGIETEGLCYVAKTIGYSCWGFPNLIGVHAQG